jgi:hypothetical protein
MGRLATAVEDRQVDPAVIGAEPDAPDDRGNACYAIIEFRPLLRRRLDRSVASFLRSGDSFFGDEAVDAGLDAFGHLIGLIKALGKIVI